MLVMSSTSVQNRTQPLNGYLAEFRLEAQETEEYPFGWRVVEEIDADGQLSYRTVILTLNDFLDPQLGDQMPQGIKHADITNQLFDKLDNFCAGQPQTLVLEDIKMVWHIPDLPEPFPDISVIHGLNRERLDENSGSFDCLKYGVRPSLIIEVMSPSYESGDRRKINLYETAGVREYIIINPRTKQPHKPFELIGYRLQGGKYQRIQPDSQGRLLSQSTGVLLGLAGEDNRTVEVYDAQTGVRLLDHRETEQARQEAERRAENEAQRAENEAQRADQAEAQLRQTVLRLLENGLPLDVITQATGLTPTDIEQIQARGK